MADEAIGASADVAATAIPDAVGMQHHTPSRAFRPDHTYVGVITVIFALLVVVALLGVATTTLGAL